MQYKAHRPASSPRSGYRYLLSLPERYQERSSWPLLVFLHGVGERGADLSVVARWGLPRVLEDGLKIPFIAASPQCGSRERWEPDRLRRLLDELGDKQRVDPGRIALSGFSMGGFAVWEFALAYPDRVAAIIPISGGGDPMAADRVKHIPCWIFHGEKDESVPASYSEEMAAAVQNAGGHPKFTIYRGLGHMIAQLPFQTSALYDWLFMQFDARLRHAEQYKQ